MGTALLFDSPMSGGMTQDNGIEVMEMKTGNSIQTATWRDDLLVSMTCLSPKPEDCFAGHKEGDLTITHH